MPSDVLTPEQFAVAFAEFLDNFRRLIPRSSGVIDDVLRHLGSADLYALSGDFNVTEHPNVQLALDDLLAQLPDARLIGLPAEVLRYGDVSLSGLLRGLVYAPVVAAPVQFLDVPVDIDRRLPCVRVGLYLLRIEGDPLAVLMARTDAPRTTIKVDVVSPAAAAARAFLLRLRRSVHEHNLYRGKVLSFTVDQYSSFGLRFHRLPAVHREDVILPPADLDAITRHTVGIANRATVLRAAGRHLKRGLLLYGPPGTGKTLSVMYLCNELRGRTTLLLNGQGLGALGQAAAIARSLQPSMLVLEDVDLVAMERTLPGMATNPMLFQLLNHRRRMDGLADDADVIFVLTTNRVDLLEPALAARPGRIDHAVEIKLPDRECRHRLFELYFRGLDHRISDFEPFVHRTEGVSAAFIKELARRTALTASEAAGDGAALVVADEHLSRALDDLLQHSAPVLRSMLGARTEHDRVR